MVGPLSVFIFPSYAPTVCVKLLLYTYIYTYYRKTFTRDANQIGAAAAFLAEPLIERTRNVLERAMRNSSRGVKPTTALNQAHGPPIKTAMGASHRILLLPVIDRRKNNIVETNFVKIHFLNKLAQVRI